MSVMNGRLHKFNNINRGFKKQSVGPKRQKAAGGLGQFHTRDSHTLYTHQELRWCNDWDIQQACGKEKYIRSLI